MQSLSVIIITKNEEDRIRNCIESIVGLSDDIIVLDSGSIDKTVDICREYTDKVFETDWPGYGKQKQRALERATGDWVLSIDADESLDKDLQDSIIELLNKTSVTECAFRLRWKNIFLGKAYNFGRASRAPKRLFKRENANFTPDEVHETIVTIGDVGIIKKGFLLHDSNRDFEHWLAKSQKYALLGSQKYARKGKKSYGIPVAVIRCFWTFFQIYILRLGVLDGSRGLLSAIMFSQYTFNKYAGLWYIEQTK